ncbi:Spore protein SP21 [bacterium HR39]|nr:Spore protein SP21 [bacterium HR39]
MPGRELVPFRTLIPANREEMVDPFVAMRREIDRLFEDFARTFRTFGMPAATTGTLVPEIDLTETEGEYRITAELPGVDPKDVTVEVRGDLLVIRGEKRDEHEERGENRHFVERRFGRFERAIRLPAEVDLDRAEAVYDKGVLTIRLPKPEAAQKPVRRIEVKAA